MKENPFKYRVVGPGDVVALLREEATDEGLLAADYIEYLEQFAPEYRPPPVTDDIPWIGPPGLEPVAMCGCSSVSTLDPTTGRCLICDRPRR